MEDIRTYLDSTGGQYHKGETHSAAILAGSICFLVGGYWVALSLYFFVFYFTSFEQVATGLSLDPPSSFMVLALATLRLFQGLFFFYLGLQAWDMRRGMLYWSWIVAPCYCYFWGGYILALDPEFRAEQVVAEHLFTYPMLSMLLFSMLLIALVVPLVTLTSWVFRPSPKDPLPAVLVGAVVAVYFVFAGVTAETPREVLTTAAIYGIRPLDAPGSGLPVLKLIALGPEALRCHENMDQLTDALARRQTDGPEINVRNWGNRPKGERLIRLLQQTNGLGDGIECGEGGYYSLDKDDGHWRCSQHGDRLSPEARRAGLGGGPRREPEE